MSSVSQEPLDGEGDLDVAAVAKAFARAASMRSLPEDQRSGKGRGGVRREERYYNDAEQGSRPAATSALTEEQVSSPPA